MYIEPIYDGKQTAVTTYRVMKTDWCSSYEVFRGGLQGCNNYISPAKYPLGVNVLTVVPKT